MTDDLSSIASLLLPFIGTLLLALLKRRIGSATVLLILLAVGLSYWFQARHEEALAYARDPNWYVDGGPMDGAYFMATECFAVAAIVLDLGPRYGWSAVTQALAATGVEFASVLTMNLAGLLIVPLAFVALLRRVSEDVPNVRASTSPPPEA